jgi:phosphoribosylamine--glycine ligase
VGFACNVVLASQGYPDSFEKGLPITGIDAAEADPYVTVFHSGTRVHADDLVTNGGRVLGVTAIGDSLADAVQRSYAACDKISFDTKYHRTDIAKRAL